MTARFAAALLVAGLAASTSAAAIESQAIGIVAPLPAEIRQVFGCGTWSTNGQAGSYRIVLVDVSERAGTEVYVQRVLEPDGLSSAPARILETIPIRELNDDHAQYSVSSARCLRDDARGTVELRATF